MSSEITAYLPILRGDEEGQFDPIHESHSSSPRLNVALFREKYENANPEEIKALHDALITILAAPALHTTSHQLIERVLSPQKPLPSQEVAIVAAIQTLQTPASISNEPSSSPFFDALTYTE